jgi:hypothetical protein
MFMSAAGLFVPELRTLPKSENAKLEYSANNSLTLRGQTLRRRKAHEQFDRNILNTFIYLDTFTVEDSDGQDGRRRDSRWVRGEGAARGGKKKELRTADVDKG